MDEQKNQAKTKYLEHWQVMALCLMICDVISVCLSYFIALWLRFDCIYSHIPKSYLTPYQNLLCPIQSARSQCSGFSACIAVCGVLPAIPSLFGPSAARLRRRSFIPPPLRCFMAGCRCRITYGAALRSLFSCCCRAFPTASCCFIR